MEKFKRIWEPVLSSFKRAYPHYYEHMVDWYPSGYLEIMVKLDDGDRLTYELLGDYIKFINVDDYQYRRTNDENEWRKNFAQCLNTRMRKTGINQCELSELTGISFVTISKYTNGRATPSAYNLERLASVLKCSVVELTAAR